MSDSATRSVAVRAAAKDLLSPSMAIMVATVPQDEEAWLRSRRRSHNLDCSVPPLTQPPLPITNGRRRRAERSFDRGSNTRVAELRHVKLLLDHAGVGVSIEHCLDTSEIGRGTRLTRKIVGLQEISVQHLDRCFDH